MSSQKRELRARKRNQEDQRKGGWEGLTPLLLNFVMGKVPTSQGCRSPLEAESLVNIQQENRDLTTTTT